MACLKNSSIGGLKVCHTSTKNLALGNGALYSIGATNCYNTAIGNQALASLNSTGVHNTAIGSGALINFCNATTGNVGVGYLAGCGADAYARDSATANTFIGSRACVAQSCTRDKNANNTFIGFRAGETAGDSDNTAIGAYALTYSRDINTTTAIGFGVGYYHNSTVYGLGGNTFIGTCAALDASNGSDNVIIGCLAGTVSGGGAGNVIIGASATNACIGYGCSNVVIIGNDFHTSAYVGSSWVTPSDCRDKTDIQNLPNNLGLNFIRKLRPVSYKWDSREKYVNKCAFDYGTKDGTLKNPKAELGFIAQEIKTALEELNVEFDSLKYNNYKDQYQIEYEALVSPIVKALQEINNEIDQLETLIQQ